MFGEYESELGNQIQLLNMGRKKSIETQFDYVCKESTNVPVGRKRILFPEQHVRALVQLFEESINPNTFELIIAMGCDVGLGLFSFADLKKDPDSGIYLTYRESVQPFMGPQPEFYLGVFQNPCNYDKVIQNGVGDTISVNKDGFEVTRNTNGCVKQLEDLERKLETLKA